MRATADAGDFADFTTGARRRYNVPRSHQWVRVALRSRNAERGRARRQKVVAHIAPYRELNGYTERAPCNGGSSLKHSPPRRLGSGNNCGTRAFFTCRRHRAPSARLDAASGSIVPNIARNFECIGIEPQCWQLEVLARGGNHFDGLLVQFPANQ
ncbi:hypothetical protein M8494_22545 [Serratia ureilytica]